MARQPDDWYRERADDILKRSLQGTRTEISEIARVEPNFGPNKPCVSLETESFTSVSRGLNPGAWVMAWVWIPDPEETENGEGSKIG